MINRLKGPVVHADKKYVIIDVAGVGYKVYATTETIARLSHKDTAATDIVVWTYLAVRENALDLYGFTSPIDLTFFELLLTVSGIGPKTALGILNVSSVEELDSAIQSGDTSSLTKISGIGKKVAEKIVLELKDKTDGLRPNQKGQAHSEGDADVLEALIALGYKEHDARATIKKISKHAGMSNASPHTIEEKVKLALKELSSH